MQDLNDKITGGTLPANEWNEVPSEIQNVIEALSITLSSGDLNQLGKAIAGYVANGTFYTDSGAADAYVLTQIGSKQAATAYTDGFEIEFIAANPNTGPSTVNAVAIGVKDIKDSAGADPAAGDITGRTICKFDLANDRFELIDVSVAAASETVAGIIEILTQAETDAGADDLRALTALKFTKATPTPKVYGNFNGTGTPTLRDSFNTTSLSDLGTGKFQITIDTDFANANYSAGANYNDVNTGVGSQNDGNASVYDYLVGSFKIMTTNGGGALRDNQIVSYWAFGDQ